MLPHLFACLDDPTRCRCPSGECVRWQSTVRRLVGTPGGCPRSNSSCHSVVTNDTQQYDHILEDLQLGPEKAVLFTVQVRTYGRHGDGCLGHLRPMGVWPT